MIDVAQISSTGVWRVEEAESGICLLTLEAATCGAPLALSGEILEDLDRILKLLEHDSAVRAVIVIPSEGSARTFPAGLDARELLAQEDAGEAAHRFRAAQRSLETLSSLPVVTIAAVDGPCTGTGLELLLACDLGVASSSPETRFGLPETQLGVIPGLGAIQRLPRRVGLSRALPLLVAGKLWSAEEAADRALVHRLAYPGRLRGESVALARQALAAGGKRFRPPRARLPWSEWIADRLLPARIHLRWTTCRRIQRRGGPLAGALRRIVDLAVDGCSIPLADGLQHEATLAGELAASPLGRRLIALYRTGEAARRGGDLAPEEPVPVLPRSGTASAPACPRVALLGGGHWGGSLAAASARRGMRVRLKAAALEPLEVALRRVHAVHAELVERGIASSSEGSRWASAVSTTIRPAGFERAGILVVAGGDSHAAMAASVREAESLAGEGTVIAVDTALERISDLQAELRCPERLVGLHFFAPPDRSPLVEVVAGERTSSWAVDTAEAFARDLGKTPVRVADRPGLLVLRLLSRYLDEGARLFEEGYHPLQMDEELRAFGVALGPLEMIDELGWDEVLRIQETLRRSCGDRMMPSSLLRRLRELRSLKGRKTGRGFYLYRGSRKRLHRALMKVGRPLGSSFKARDEELWVERLIYPVIDEAARMLSEGVVSSASAIDLAMVAAAGFLPGRGGPLRYADELSPASIAAALEGLREPRLAPGEPLLAMAREKRSFHAPAASAAWTSAASLL
ncbi:MAG: enoyl-CoA hydratase/isomerase family protein [Planctomycetes bacterium]|nr:enoyl-CoA hydratase/isomerase family protein [Planctomycetota bacterium]